MDILYRIDGAGYKYLQRFTALDGVTFEIKRGESVALLGVNGSGKSTLLLILAALIFPYKGSLSFAGRNITEEASRSDEFQAFFRSRVGIVFQNSDMQLFNSSVKDEIEFGLIQLGLPKDIINSRVGKYADIMGITRILDRYPHNLSIGEKKRVAIASVLVMEPEVILLDEPTAGLDPRTVRHLIGAISCFAKEGRTVITATQDMHIVNEISERVIIMGEDKRIIRDGRADEILNDRTFLERENLIHAHAHTHGPIIHIHPHEHSICDHKY